MAWQFAVSTLPGAFPVDAASFVYDFVDDDSSITSYVPSSSGDGAEDGYYSSSSNSSPHRTNKSGTNKQTGYPRSHYCPVTHKEITEYPRLFPPLSRVLRAIYPYTAPKGSFLGGMVEICIPRHAETETEIETEPEDEALTLILAQHLGRAVAALGTEVEEEEMSGNETTVSLVAERVMLVQLVVVYVALCVMRCAGSMVWMVGMGVWNLCRRVRRSWRRLMWPNGFADDFITVDNDLARWGVF